MPVGDVGNAWDTGEREISWRQDLWTRTSRKPVAPFSTMAALGYFREISAPSPQNQCWSAVSSLRMRELDFDRALVSKVSQSELVNRMLKWPKHLSNTAALTTLEVPTVRS